MDVRGLELEDYHDVVNALLDGPSEEAKASFHIDWTRSSDRERFRHPPGEWSAKVMLNSARAEWSAETATARYVSDPAAPSFSLFEEVGHERSGVFFF